MLVIWSLFVPCILYLRLSKFQLSPAPGCAGSYGKETSVDWRDGGAVLGGLALLLRGVWCQGGLADLSARQGSFRDQDVVDEADQSGKDSPTGENFPASIWSPLADSLYL